MPSEAKACSLSFDVRQRTWPLDYVHAHMPLEAAAQIGRAVGPTGERVAWLDTETTGLAGGTGTYVFLVGIGAVEDGHFVLTQYFMRDLGGEIDMLEALAEHLRRFDALVTFNGSRFDLPLLQTRFLLSRLRHDFESSEHLDVMSLARRLWYRRLGGYSMALLEQMVLKVDRFVDVAGWMIPSLYVQYLQTGDLDAIEPVFAHNAADLLSLLSLHGLTGEIVTHPQKTRVAVDWAGLGRLLDARGRCEAAVECYRTALQNEHHQAIRRRTVAALAQHYRLSGRIQELLELWESEAQRRILAPWQPLERLAMIWEWDLRQPARALVLAQQALSRVEESDRIVYARLDRRRQRLLEKCQR